MMNYLKFPIALATLSLAWGASGAVDVRQSSVMLVQMSGHLLSRTETTRVSIVKRGEKLFLQAAISAGVIENPLPGSYVWSSNGVPIGLQLRDLSGNGLEQIICATSDGASLGADIRIFRISADKFVAIPPVEGGYDIKFIDVANKTELIIYGKWTEGSSATVSALRLEGTSMVEDEQESVRLFRDRLRSLEDGVLAQIPKSPGSRLQEARPVFEIYLQKSEYDANLDFCKRLLNIINDNRLLAASNRSPSNLKEMGFKRPEDMIEIDRLNAEAGIHKMMAEIYGKSGNEEQQAVEEDISDALYSKVSDLTAAARVAKSNSGR